MVEAMVGDTVKEYIAYRRLSLAAQELVRSDKKVIDWVKHSIEHYDKDTVSN